MGIESKKEQPLIHAVVNNLQSPFWLPPLRISSMTTDSSWGADPFQVRKQTPVCVRVATLFQRLRQARRVPAKVCGILTLLVLIIARSLAAAEDPLVLPVWPGAVPRDYGKTGPERVRAPSESPTKDAKWITNVTKPTITIFRPAKEQNTGTAILICPGGGYWNLAWDLEGEEVAAWLNTIGVTGIVLKYRVPRRPDQPERLPAPGPLLDAQRASCRRVGH